MCRTSSIHFFLAISVLWLSLCIFHWCSAYCDTCSWPCLCRPWVKCPMSSPCTPSRACGDRIDALMNYNNSTSMCKHGCTHLFSTCMCTIFLVLPKIAPTIASIMSMPFIYKLFIQFHEDFAWFLVSAKVFEYYASQCLSHFTLYIHIPAHATSKLQTLFTTFTMGRLKNEVVECKHYEFENFHTMQGVSQGGPSTKIQSVMFWTKINWFFCFISHVFYFVIWQ